MDIAKADDLDTSKIGHKETSRTSSAIDIHSNSTSTLNLRKNKSSHISHFAFIVFFIELEFALHTS